MNWMRGLITLVLFLPCGPALSHPEPDAAEDDCPVLVPPARECIADCRCPAKRREYVKSTLTLAAQRATEPC